MSAVGHKKRVSQNMLQRTLLMGSEKRSDLDSLGAMGFGRGPDVIASVVCDEVCWFLDACVTGEIITKPWSAKHVPNKHSLEAQTKNSRAS